MSKSFSWGGLVFLLSKIGIKLAPIGVKMFKCLKVGKVAFAAATFGSYAYMFSWKFALLIMLLILIHESGHVWAMKKMGMKTKGFYFIPFLGGAAVADEDFPSRRAEVFVAIMGPIFGLALCMLAGLAYLITNEPVYAAAAAWMSVINLFNLLPINPLDGGRIFKSIAFSMASWAGIAILVLSILALVGLAVVAKFWLFVALLIVCVIELSFEFAMRNSYAKPKMCKSEMGVSFGAYSVVCLMLWVVMALTESVPGAAAAFELMK